MSTAVVPQQEVEKRFDWPVCYQAEELFLGRCAEFLEQNRFARELAHRMREGTGTLFLDWVDYIGFPGEAESALREAGFTEDPRQEISEQGPALYHPEALL